MIQEKLRPAAEPGTARNGRTLDRLRPARVLELASGSGRVTIPLARLAAGIGCEIVGLEIAEPMLAEAERKRAELDPPVRRHVRFARVTSVLGPPPNPST